VSENLVENNYRYGIALYTFSSGNKVSENVVTGTSEFFGIGLTWSLDNEPIPGPSGNLIQGNTAIGNSAFDLFHAEFSTPNVWQDNTCETSSGADIDCPGHE
jgi:parallel beta-helix repeat protein